MINNKELLIKGRILPHTSKERRFLRRHERKNKKDKKFNTYASSGRKNLTKKAKRRILRSKR